MTLLPRATEANGSVYVIDGQVYARVTAILNVIHNPILDRWRRKVGFVEADRISKEATEFGTRLHKAIEEICQSGAFADAQPEEELAPHLWPLQEWLFTNVAEVIATEQTIVHRGLTYAGTCDAVLLLKDGRTVVADWKSSNSVSNTWQLQTAAYMAALLHSGEQIDGRLVVQLPSKRPGELHVHEYDNHAEDWKLFRAALRLYRWQEGSTR